MRAWAPARARGIYYTHAHKRTNIRNTHAQQLQREISLVADGKDAIIERLENTTISLNERIAMLESQNNIALQLSGKIDSHMGNLRPKREKVKQG